MIVEAYFLILKTQFLAFSFPARLAEKALASGPAKDPAWAPSMDTKKKLLSLFRIAWRYQLKKPRCLSTSLAQQAFLKRHGFPTRFRIGVQKAGEFRAHAWCEDVEPKSPFHPLETL